VGVGFCLSWAHMAYDQGYPLCVNHNGTVGARELTEFPAVEQSTIISKTIYDSIYNVIKSEEDLRGSGNKMSSYEDVLKSSIISNMIITMNYMRTFDGNNVAQADRNSDNEGFNYGSKIYMAPGNNSYKSCQTPLSYKTLYSSGSFVLADFIKEIYSNINILRSTCVCDCNFCSCHGDEHKHFVYQYNVWCYTY
jgi:hypothetical protein